MNYHTRYILSLNVADTEPLQLLQLSSLEWELESAWRWLQELEESNELLRELEADCELLKGRLDAWRDDYPALFLFATSRIWHMDVDYDLPFLKSSLEWELEAARRRLQELEEAVELSREHSEDWFHEYPNLARFVPARIALIAIADWGLNSIKMKLGVVRKLRRELEENWELIREHPDEWFYEHPRLARFAHVNVLAVDDDAVRELLWELKEDWEQLGEHPDNWCDEAGTRVIPCHHPYLSLSLEGKGNLEGSHRSPSLSHTIIARKIQCMKWKSGCT